MEIMELIEQNRVIAIVRGMHPDQMAPLARALERGGIRMMEITFNQNAPETFQNTVNAIRTLSQNMRDMAIGAGTVMTLEQLHMAADAGARYIISPDVNPALIAETKRLGLTSLPGAMSPTEIVTAWNAVKVFPIGDLGVGYLKAIRAPISCARARLASAWADSLSTANGSMPASFIRSPRLPEKSRRPRRTP